MKGKQDKQQGEGNRLIAEFDGWQSNKYHNLPNKLHKMEAGEEVGIAINQLEYHSSWDWLMPVVEKIAATPSISITIKYFTVENGDKIVGSCEIKRTFWPQHGVVNTEPIAYKKEFAEKLSVIKIVWDCVIQFIKWYKLNSK